MKRETAITRADALPIQSMGDLHEIGKLLVQTDLFGTKNPADGFTIACICQQSGITFAEFMQNFHFIKGRISKRADAMQADFQKAGGVIEIVQRDEEGTVINLTLDKTKYTSRCLWKEIQGEPFVTNPKDQNYKTPRKRMQMMWARAISDGVRVVYPAAVQGVYTPEETDDFAEADNTPPPKPLPDAEASKRTQEHAQQVIAVVSPPPCEQPDAEPDPFDLARNTLPPDYSICPIEGSLFRMKWTDMPTEHLNIALTLKMPQPHKDAVAEVIATRQSASGKGAGQ
ncbi:MAG: hypothetical protein FWH21_02500 [Kiritimatiellaeota bacterium]|nr:hypothetical protein [Kiritimatiellota bacterium]